MRTTEETPNGRHALAEQAADIELAGKVGFRALGSVSEHVAHHVPASVMVARTSRTKEAAR